MITPQRRANIITTASLYRTSRYPRHAWVPAHDSTTVAYPTSLRHRQLHHTIHIISSLLFSRPSQLIAILPPQNLNNLPPHKSLIHRSQKPIHNIHTRIPFPAIPEPLRFKMTKTNNLHALHESQPQSPTPNNPPHKADRP